MKCFRNEWNKSGTENEINDTVITTDTKKGLKEFLYRWNRSNRIRKWNLYELKNYTTNERRLSFTVFYKQENIATGHFIKLLCFEN